MMVVSSEENALIEQSAKLEALRELLEDDLSQGSPSQATIINIQDNHPAFKQLYLDTRVAFNKYKARFVPKLVTEEEFNSTIPQENFN